LTLCKHTQRDLCVIIVLPKLSKENILYTSIASSVLEFGEIYLYSANELWISMGSISMQMDFEIDSLDKMTLNAMHTNGVGDREVNLFTQAHS